MEKSLQIKRRNEVIGDIKCKDFRLDMSVFAVKQPLKHFCLRENVEAHELAERNLCNTPMCIAGDAARRMAIVEQKRFSQIARRFNRQDYGGIFVEAGMEYLGLKAGEEVRLFTTANWDKDLQAKYMSGTIDERKAAAIEMLKRVIPD